MRRLKFVPFAEVAPAFYSPPSGETDNFVGPIVVIFGVSIATRMNSNGVVYHLKLKAKLHHPGSKHAFRDVDLLVATVDEKAESLVGGDRGSIAVRTAQAMYTKLLGFLAECTNNGNVGDDVMCSLKTRTDGIILIPVVSQMSLVDFDVFKKLVLAGIVAEVKRVTKEPASVAA